MNDLPGDALLLSDEVLLLLEGPDSRNFLHGQTTADFAQSAPGAAIAGAFCDLKGRVLTDFLAVVISESRIVLRVRAALASRLSEHLKKYLMFAKSSLTPLPGAVFGSAGGVGSQLPTGDATVDTPESIEVGTPLLTVPRWGNCAEHWHLEGSGPSAKADLDRWHCLAIQAGEARIESVTWGRYLPQDLNYDLRHWVSFNKGCYTGQEVIARLHFRGQPKRRLSLAQVGATAAIEPGTPVFREGSEQAAGSIVNAAHASADRQLVLVETTAGALDTGLFLPGSGQRLEPL